MKKSVVFQFISGAMIGALLFGGAAAIASGITAQPKTADVVIDGQVVELKGYVIDGSHYFQLRDISGGLRPGRKDFSVVWDGANNRVLIDTRRGYDPDETITVPAASLAQSASIDEMKQEVVRLTNIERVRAGLSEVEAMPELMGCAQLKAEDMIRNGYFGHTSPVYGSANEMIRAQVPGYRSACENIGIGGTDPADVVAGWMESEGHRDNLLNPRMTHIGVGIAENSSGTLIWVQQLMRAL